MSVLCSRLIGGSFDKDLGAPGRLIDFYIEANGLLRSYCFQGHAFNEGLTFVCHWHPSSSDGKLQPMFSAWRRSAECFQNVRPVQHVEDHREGLILSLFSKGLQSFAQYQS